MDTDSVQGKEAMGLKKEILSHRHTELEMMIKYPSGNIIQEVGSVELDRGRTF